MTTTIFDIEKFDYDMNFTMWKFKIHVSLVQNGLEKATLGESNMPDSMSEDKKDELILKTLLIIQLFLSNEVLQEIIIEDIVAGLWSKLESLYMIKTLTNKLCHLTWYYLF